MSGGTDLRYFEDVQSRAELRRLLDNQSGRTGDAEKISGMKWLLADISKGVSVRSICFPLYALCLGRCVVVWTCRARPCVRGAATVFVHQSILTPAPPALPSPPPTPPTHSPTHPPIHPPAASRLGWHPPARVVRTGDECDVGHNASELYADVVKLVSSKDLELKKLVYMCVRPRCRWLRAPACVRAECVRVECVRAECVRAECVRAHAWGVRVFQCCPALSRCCSLHTCLSACCCVGLRRNRERVVVRLCALSFVTVLRMRRSDPTPILIVPLAGVRIITIAHPIHLHRAHACLHAATWCTTATSTKRAAT
jgi:hypothetical protein